MKSINLQSQFELNQMVNNHVGLFAESSSLRKLFHSSADFLFCMTRITRYGPPHECYNTCILMHYAEWILDIINKNIDILPIEDGVTLTCYSPSRTEMILPLKYPNAVLKKTRII